MHGMYGITRMNDKAANHNEPEPNGTHKKPSTQYVPLTEPNPASMDMDEVLSIFRRSVYWNMSKVIPEDWVHAEPVQVQLRVPYGARMVLRYFAEAIEDPVQEFEGVILSELVRIGMAKTAMDVSREIMEGEPVVEIGGAHE